MTAQKNKVLRAKNDLCTGCMMCVLMCSLAKTGIVNPHLSRIRVTLSDKDNPHTVTFCRHCKNPPCQKACPIPDAMYLDDNTGAVIINESICIGCLACVDACPFGAIQVGPNREILKCDLCGGDPLCVKYCPTRPENGVPSLVRPGERCLEYIAPDRIKASALKTT